MTEAIFPIPNQTRLAHPLEFVMLQIEVRQASVSTVLIKIIIEMSRGWRFLWNMN